VRIGVWVGVRIGAWSRAGRRGLEETRLALEPGLGLRPQGLFITGFVLDVEEALLRAFTTVSQLLLVWRVQIDANMSLDGLTTGCGLWGDEDCTSRTLGLDGVDHLTVGPVFVDRDDGEIDKITTEILKTHPEGSVIGGLDATIRLGLGGPVGAFIAP